MVESFFEEMETYGRSKIVRKWKEKHVPEMKVFTEQSRKIRNDKKINIKNAIQRSASKIYHSHHYSFNNKASNEYLEYVRNELKLANDQSVLNYVSLSQWKDIYFMSKDNRTFYNCEVITSSMDFGDSLSNIKDNFTIEELDEFNMNEELLEDFHNDKKFNIVTESNIFNPLRYQERMEFLKGYKYGIGVKMVIDAPYLTVENVYKMIYNFWENGEQFIVSNKKPQLRNLDQIYINCKHKCELLDIKLTGIEDYFKDKQNYDKLEDICIE